MELHTDRPSHMGDPGSIPFSSIYAYSQAYNISGEDFIDFSFLIRKMDHAWLDYQRGQGSKGESSKPGMIEF